MNDQGQRIYMRRRIFTAVLATLLVLSSPAYSYDGVATGQIGVVEVTDAASRGFRVWFTSGTNMCPSSPARPWAYLNEADNNYKIYVATLLSAKAMGSNVTIWTNIVGNYCHIMYVSAS
jgi:hypothetical protein